MSLNLIFLRNFIKIKIKILFFKFDLIFNKNPHFRTLHILSNIFIYFILKLLYLVFKI
jgi:hypothetical protein